jgi:1-acyl-sn-glycerol-3-phosphate acyltransferase
VKPSLEPTWLRRFAAPLIHLLAWLLARILPGHVRAFLHSARIPSDGPLIVVANHQSYFDGQLLAMVFYMLTGRRLYSVSNVKAFKGPLRRLYYEIVGDIRVDPRDVDDTYLRLRRELEQGKALLMYPEGHRSDGTKFLPFRYGAFNLAARLNVPILPIGLRDAGRVLPKGALWYRRGVTAALAVAEPLHPEDFRTRSDDDVRACARAMCAEAQRVLERLVYGDEARLFTPQALKREAESVARRTRDALELLLDDGAENISRAEASRVLCIARLGRMLRVPCGALETQYVRAYGFWVGALPKIVALFLLPRFRRMIEARLAEDPLDPYANYVLGQFHVQVPRLLGGDRARAVTGMRTAYLHASTRSLNPARFVVGYATALSQVGERDDALVLLRRHFGAGPEGPSERLVRRFHRAQRLLESLTENESERAHTAS